MLAAVDARPVRQLYNLCLEPKCSGIKAPKHLLLYKLPKTAMGPQGIRMKNITLRSGPNPLRQTAWA